MALCAGAILLAGAAQAAPAMAEGGFPDGAPGRGDFQVFPRWQRVLSETKPVSELAALRREENTFSQAYKVDTGKAGAAAELQPAASAARLTFTLPAPSARLPERRRTLTLRPPVERGAVATAPAEQAVEKTARLTLPEGILVPLIRPERGQEKQAASAMPVFNFLPPVERPAQTAQTKEAPAPQTPPAQVAPREQAADCRAKGACALDDWARVIDSALDLSPAEKLDRVNSWANGIAYVDDMSNWGMSDHWQTPAEFLANGGDCEDYAIIKYFGLVELGFSPADMRIMVLYDEAIKTHHAVLLVRLNGKIKLLDNQKKTVADLADAPNYRPIYSLNQQNWWLHKKPEPVRLVPTRPARYAAQAAARQRFR
jgi:predicted transglutaminase-like cysteine proteinase